MLVSAAAMRQRFTRRALALAVAAMGAVDLWSALLSHPSDRLLALRHLIPTEVLDTSRTFTLLAGALLLVTAWGLRKGKRRAFVAALLLCAVSVPVNLFKAFDFEEASAATALMFLLGISGQAFQVKSRELSFGAELIDAARAREIGLVNRVVAPNDVMNEAQQFAESVLQGAPGALTQTKRLVEELWWRSVKEDVDLALRYHVHARESDEAREGIAAFNEKRKPNWARGI